VVHAARGDDVSHAKAHIQRLLGGNSGGEDLLVGLPVVHGQAVPVVGVHPDGSQARAGLRESELGHRALMETLENSDGLHGGSVPHDNLGVGAVLPRGNQRAVRVHRERNDVLRVVQVILLRVINRVVNNADARRVVADGAVVGVPGVVPTVGGAVAVDPLQLELGVRGGRGDALVDELGGYERLRTYTCVSHTHGGHSVCVCVCVLSVCVRCVCVLCVCVCTMCTMHDYACVCTLCVCTMCVYYVYVLCVCVLCYVCVYYVCVLCACTMCVCTMCVCTVCVCPMCVCTHLNDVHPRRV